MSEEQEKKALIVSNSGEGIKKEVEKTGFTVIGVIPHDQWSIHLEAIDSCHLVVLDEIDQDFSQNLALGDEEERVLLGDQGPLVLVLVRVDDDRLDKRATTHSRWKVHHKQQPLDMILEELYLALPQYSRPLDTTSA